MAKPLIADLVVTQTFQNWFDKTNELTGIIRSEAVTASAGGDTTVGNATLTGTFTATEFVGNFNADEIGAATNGGSITFTSPTIHNSLSDGICATFEFGGSGGKTRYTDTNISWDIGIEDSTNANFKMDTGTGLVKFLLSPAGTVTTNNLILREDLDVNDITANNATFTNDVTANNGIFNNLTFNGQSLDDQYVNISGDTMTGSLTVQGNIFATGDVTTNYSISDVRLKENIEVIDNALEKVKEVGGYTFNYIERPDERVSGVIAQEIEKILPGVVYETNEEGYKGVRYDNIIPLLIQAIKELNDKVEKLESQV